MREHELCGLARSHAEAFGHEARLRRCLRLLARGDRAGAATLVPPPFQRGPGSSTCVEAAAYLREVLARETGAGAADATADARQRLLARVAQLDAEIERGRSLPADAVMWHARALIERSQAALALGEPARASTDAKQAIDALSAVWGADHLEVGGYWDDLATALIALGQEPEARAAMERAQAIRAKNGVSSGGLG